MSDIYQVSVIIPVYNVALYITKCMDSLLAQTMQEIEVLFVDDKGTDESMQMIANYIASHHLQECWHIVTMPENGGPGLARNLGIQKATGKYIVFVDADDWLEPDMCNALYELIEQQHAELVMCNAYCHNQGKITILSHPHYHSSRYFLTHYIPRLWTFMFSKEFIHQYNLQFPPERSAEDSYFIALSVMHAQRVAQLKRPLYHYIVRPTSISHIRDTKRYRQKLNVFARLLRYASSHNLMPQYRWSLYWIYFKKALVTSAVDFLVSIMPK